jgi:hypothetical protein
MTIAAGHHGRTGQLHRLSSRAAVSLWTYSCGSFIFCHTSQENLFTMGATHLSLSKDISDTGQLLTVFTPGQYRHRLL